MTQTPGRRERKKQQTREKIARVALELFIERGFEQVTVTEVAEAADVSVNTVYNYFPTKEDLFFGLNQPMETSLAGIVRQREKGEPLFTFLRHLLLGSLEPLKRCRLQRRILRGSRSSGCFGKALPCKLGADK